ncbi:MAG: heme-binding protein [Rhodospirillales bacterium]|nr:heme-binding protein [Rhodospirillales bacterium]
MLKYFTAALVITFAANMAPAKAEEKALVEFKMMTPETALELARATLADCQKRGYQIAVTVVDRFGNVQVTLRDRFAGAHTPDTARRKAWTAVSFRTDTLAMEELIRNKELTSGVRHVAGALMIGGGVPVQAGGSIVGGVGVSGAPGGKADDDCARVGIEAIADKLAF